MYADRLPLYRQLEGERASKVIALVNGDRPGLETQLHPDVLDPLVHHLDCVGEVPRISLILYTCGGHTLTAWSIVNLLRQFCDELEVIVPAKALSSGTLICLGADRIVMTKQATLGPIDPSINGPLNPSIEGGTVPVSAEAVNGYLEFARAALGGEGRGMAAVLERLSGQIHPLVLGGAYRSRMQMRMIGRRLLGRQIKDDASIERVLEFLCSDSGSHDYTIYQREARDELGLRVEPAGETGYRILRALQLDFTGELELLKPFDSQAVLGRQTTAYYVLRGGLLESVAGGSHVHRTRGRVWQQKVQIQPGVHESMIMNEQKFEGWCHDV